MMMKTHLGKTQYCIFFNCEKYHFSLNFFFIFSYFVFKKSDCEYSLEPPPEAVLSSAGSIMYPQYIGSNIRKLYTHVHPSFTIQHYENTPMQYTEIFYVVKNKNFQ